MKELIELFAEKVGRYPRGNVQDELRAWLANEIITLRQKLEQAEQENERVRQANLDVMMHFEDMKAAKEKAEARVAKLEAEALYLRARDDALVDFLCNESGVDLVSVKAACGHIPREDAWLLRKQAEAVEAFVEPYYRTPFTRGIVMDGQEYAQRLRQQADEAERAGGEK